MDEELTLFGRLDSITPDGLAVGWCWCPQEPNTHRSINLVAEGKVVATVLCDQNRPELVTIGVGNGSHGFEIRISRTHFPPEPGVVAVQMQDAKTGQAVGTPVNFSYPAAPSLSNLPVRLERVHEEGLVNGWCWDPADPARRVTLVVLVDGKPVGLTVADIYRADLKESGIGDGAHAFSFLLPWEAIADKSVCQISIADRATGQLLPASAMYRRRALQPVEHRLAELERQVRLLNARLDDATRRSRSEAARTAGLLATIGAFFSRLAEASQDDDALAPVPSLPELVEMTRAQLPPLTLAGPVDPVLTLVIAARGSIEAVHGCLTAIKTAGLDALADIVVIDSGAVANAALLPSLVQNMRYWQIQPGQTVLQAGNLIASRAKTRWIAWLSPASRLTLAWWQAARATFERRPETAVLGAKLLRDDGLVEASGLLADAHGRLVDFGHGEDAANPRVDMLQPVAAVSDALMVVDGPIFAELGGFDTTLTDVRAAFIEYGIRCWENGRSVLYQPVTGVAWHDPDAILSSEPLVADPGFMLWLAQRWASAARTAWPVPLGQVLLVDGPAESTPGWDASETALILQGLGWRVSFGVAGGLDREDPRAPGLRALGVQVLRPPFHPSITAAIEAGGGIYSFIVIGAGALPSIPPERVLAVSPKTKIALALGDLMQIPPPDTLLAAVHHSACTILRNARMANALAACGHDAKLRRFTGRTLSSPKKFFESILGEILK